MGFLWNKNHQDKKIEEVKEVVTDHEELVKTKLVFHPDWEMSNQEKYVYRFEHQKLPLLKPNQISISGLKLLEHEGDIVVIAFLRNTLQKAVRFDSINLVIVDKENQPIAKREFDMDSIEELEAMSCMPWRFLFTQEDRLSDTIPDQDWKIAFELQSKSTPEEHQLDLDQSWENQVSPVQKEQLVQLVASLPTLGSGEVNFMGIEAKFLDDHSFAVTMLIRNGSHKNIQLEQIPLIVEDAQGDIICQGGFKLESFEVKANTSKPWTFMFPAQLIMKTNPDLTKWRAYPPQQ